MTTSYVPAPGTIGLSPIHGRVGFAIALAQLLCGFGSRYSHAFVVLDDGTVLEAMPSGARIRPLADRLDWSPVVWGWTVDLTPQEAARVVQEARRLVGVPYSYLDYLSLLLLRLGVRRGWVLRRVQSTGHMICSQLVDEVYSRAGVPLFDDGRFSGDVMPGALADVLLSPRWFGDDAALRAA